MIAILREPIGFGFIKFVTHDSAERALTEMNGYFFLGRSMRVAWALDSEKKASQSLMEQATYPKKNQTAEVHVMFVTKELKRRVSELDLGAVFSPYGNLVDIAIKKIVMNNVRIFSQSFFSKFFYKCLIILSRVIVCNQDMLSFTSP